MLTLTTWHRFIQPGLGFLCDRKVMASFYSRPLYEYWMTFTYVFIWAVLKNNFCYITYRIRHLFFFHWQHKGSNPRSDWHHKSQSIPQIFQTVVVLSVIPNPNLSLDNPLGLYCYTQCTACDKGYKFAQHQYFTLKKLYKNSTMTLTFSANLKSFIKDSCFDLLSRHLWSRQGNAPFMTI
jgi:hypothetical protein